jgi:Mn2+/Fe2+ NRAMP family transporter
LFAIVVTGRYWTFEKITLFFCLFNLVYIPAAIWAMQTGNVAGGWSAVAQGFYSPEFRVGETLTAAGLITLIMANIGTTITPWQIFFQQSAVVDKGMDIRDVKYGKIDTLAGAFLTCLVAVFIIVATAAVFYYNPYRAEELRQIDSAAKTAAAMARPDVMPNAHWGQWAKVLFAVGLFDAGLLGALCISLATSWALGEVFGWAHSLNKGVREAPWFYAVYLLMLLSSGAIVLIPGAPLITITMFVQVVAVTLLPSALVFLILILNSPEFMGERVNTRWQNIANWSIVLFVTVMSTLFALSTLFPQWFGAAQ